MKKNRFPFALLLLLGLFLVSCKNPEGETVRKGTVPENNASNFEIPLNQGSRWQANPETTSGIRAMQEHLRSYTPDKTEYGTLKKSLEQEWATLVKECTMTGEAHDRLHDYLMPLKEAMDQLDTSDTKVAKGAFVAVRNHLQVYDKYFE